MALTVAIVTDSGAISTGGLVLKALEITPDGGGFEVRILQGTDTTGTELYRIRASERSEFRYFHEGIQLNGPLYLYFYDGDGAVTVMY